MTRISRHSSPTPPPNLLIGIVIVLLVVTVYSLVQHFLDRQNYESAMTSYKMTDCGSAIPQFNQVIGAFRLFDNGDYVGRSKEKKAECEFFEEAVKSQEEGKLASALLSYAKLAVYDNSSLREPARGKLRDLFQREKMESLATLDVCDRLETLIKGDLLPKSDANIPLLYSECGKEYEAKKSYQKAIAVYETFLKQYPDHSLANDIKQSLARTTVADIRDKGAGNINQPGKVGTTDDGSTVIEIQNSSPSEIRITFSGKTPKFGSIESCKDCIKYVEPPKSCPDKGPVGRYTLVSGQYDIAVKLTSGDGTPVRPWTGTWLLESGAEYKSCFFIIKNPLGTYNERQKNSP